ncbi:putative quinol monooxygenase [Mucilaginibacter kameinonensis]|uniref:putative quinol monooxygenase n=1 Tax=Mucilaginibacter kameinonensis TaxID=452286 RepID=UPI000EF7A110|nr:antibiotic biosynthesis monooxygenase [Mucilaginibacter kameinonensis]
MNGPKVIILAELIVDLGFLDEVKAAAKKSVALALQEPGIELFKLTYNPMYPNCLYFFEVYTSKAAHDAHLQTPHAQEFFAFSKGKMLNPSKLTHLSEF